MADKYLKSGASGSADGSSWTNAYTTMVAAGAGMAAGDRLFVSHQHVETQASAMTIVFPGTNASPNIILCVNDGATPPTTLATTAQVSTTGANALTINGAVFVYGVKFSVGSGSVSAEMQLNAHATVAHEQVYEECEFTQGSTNTTTQTLRLGSSATATVARSVVWRNCRAKFSGTGNRIENIYCDFRWEGGAILSGSTTPNHVFCVARNFMTITGVDFSNLANTVKFVGSSATVISHGPFLMRNSKLPASWSGSLLDTAATARKKIAIMHNCDSADTTYRLWEEGYAGSVREEATIVRTGSAAAQALKMVSTANAEYPVIALESPEISKYNSVTGSAITVTVDVIHDSTTALKDDEVWLEVQYLGTSGFPVSSFLTDCKGGSTSQRFGDPLATATDQTSSSATWTTTGLTNPNKQKLAVTFTPQEAGYIHAKVHLAKASYTLYVDTDLQVS